LFHPATQGSLLQFLSGPHDPGASNHYGRMMERSNNSNAGGYELSDILWDGISLLIVNVVLWLISIPLRKTWPVDFIWSNFPICQCIAIYVRNKPSGNQDRQMMVMCLICIWGFRLTHNFISRGGIGHEDWRYADMRMKFGKYFWFVSFFSVFLAQSVFLWGACLSLYSAISKSAPITYQDWIAFSLTLSAILLETISDIQMNNFISLRKEKKTDKVIMDTGLWKWSRHPNYLGEVLFWWGIYLFSSNKNNGRNDWWVVLGPVAMTLLIAFVSIKLMEDRQLERKERAFILYQQQVGSALLLLPPCLNRVLGQRLYGNKGGDSGINDVEDHQET